MIAEDVQGLSDGFVKGLHSDMDGMLDAEGIAQVTLQEPSAMWREGEVSSFILYRDESTVTGI